MLWEDQFYEDGVTIADRIAALVPKVKAEAVAAMAIEAREDMKLRHAPLLIVREMARHETHRGLVADTLARIVQRPDELTEFLAIYWADALGPMQQRKKAAVSAQVKKGLARAFEKFDAYQLAKYDRDGAVRLRDVLFITHAKPKDAAQEKIWKQLIDGKLSAPDTWEVALSGGADKKEAFERLIAEKKLGALALLRNLRGMLHAGVSKKTIGKALDEMRTDRVLPYRFIAAAQHAPDLETELEHAMFRSIEGHAKLSGKTRLLVDVSGSMDSPLSGRSEMRRLEAACGLAVLAREISDDVEIYTFSNAVKKVPPRRALPCAMRSRSRSRTRAPNSARRSPRSTKRACGSSSSPTSNRTTASARRKASATWSMSRRTNTASAMATGAASTASPRRSSIGSSAWSKTEQGPVRASVRARLPFATQPQRFARRRE